MKILLVTDRSAGHLFPALALARAAQTAGHNVTLFTTSAYLGEYVPEDIACIVGKDLNRAWLLREMFLRSIEAVRIIFCMRPDKIIGFGGRGSLFFILFGALFLRDTGLYEPNVRMGKANRFLRHLVRAIWYGLPPHNITATMKSAGIPRHPGIRHYEKDQARKKLGLDLYRPVVFCFGGSQGSEFLNETFKKIIQEDVFFQAIHLTGERDYYQFCEFYDKIMRKEYFVKKSYKDIGLLYSAADIVICRAGALTIAEIVFFRIPAILIPYPGAEGHQRANALFLTGKGAAYYCEQNESAYAGCASILREAFADRQKLDMIREKLSSVSISVDDGTFYSSIFSGEKKD
ncbi:MAG: UDP-N-acetylglucosamine--N-acetylmuramyl-(pentapeptide) pyrophosphoryl-undecaprenol N-acetylglucosamine transferase [Candidatus Omnitrophica bacterium]|nr:UDP-N-acetylglucosamine--N-acetylmuramyl-(pentapeptide) pyrophosphoryl-undecaprenol N-acetylglucosamine transferase [Candidatus Omnitrophota bacterium]